MILDAILRELPLSLRAGSAEVEITDVTDDSRRVTPGCLFVARGTGDDRWRDYATQATERGAAAVVAPASEGFEVPDSVAMCVGDEIDQSLAGQIAAIFFGHPAKQLKLLGVTGTNGKTTVATLIQHLLNAAGSASEAKCGLIGTVAIDEGSPDGPLTAELTTPGAIDLHRHFAAMVANGCDACAMEVSSHALDQGRVDGLEFDVAVFTNLTQDHLDYHGTMENYAEAKAKLLDRLDRDGVAVINCEDQGLKQINVPIYVNQVMLSAVSNELGHADVAAWPLAMDASGSFARFDGAWGSFEAKIPLVGEHNLMNALQALCAVNAVVPWSQRDWSHDLESLPQVPGRLEAVKLPSAYKPGGVPAVLVDYAHTPDALVNVLAALRLLTKGRLICVFGCGGDRDRAKRPKMAAAVCEGADVLWLTSDNPRTEDPQQILDDATIGVPRKRRGVLTVEIDRARAISGAVMAAVPGDTVLIAGKGHEDYQVLGTEKIHFDDREHAAAALQAWAEQHGSASA